MDEIASTPHPPSSLAEPASREASFADDDRIVALRDAVITGDTVSVARILRSAPSRDHALRVAWSAACAHADPDVLRHLLRVGGLPGIAEIRALLINALRDHETPRVRELLRALDLDRATLVRVIHTMPGTTVIANRLESALGQSLSAFGLIRSSLSY